MSKASTLNSLPRRLSGFSLIGAPLVGLAAALLTPQYTGGMAGELAFIAEQPERWIVANFLTLLSLCLMIPALFALLHLLRHRSIILGYVGGGLVLLGLYFHGAIIGYSLVEAPLVANWGNTPQVLRFSEQMYEHTAFTIILMPFLGFYLGWVLVSIALWRADVAPLWVMLLIIIGLLSEFVGPEVVSPELMFLLFLIGFGWLGRRILRLSDAEWSRRDEDMASAGEPAII